MLEVWHPWLLMKIAPKPRARQTRVGASGTGKDEGLVDLVVVEHGERVVGAEGGERGRGHIRIHVGEAVAADGVDVPEEAPCAWKRLRGMATVLLALITVVLAPPPKSVPSSFTASQVMVRNPPVCGAAAVFLLPPMAPSKAFKAPGPRPKCWSPPLR